MLMTVQIAVLIGSLRRDSYNRRLAYAVQKLAPSDVAFKELRISDLPLYNQDDDNNPAEQVKRLKSEISGSQGVIFVTPEYNRSLPGVLKNAIDHASRPYGQSAWAGKPAGIIGASIGAIGSAVSQQHLRGVLAYLDMPTLAQPEVFLQVDDNFFAADGGFANDRTKKFLQSWMDAYVGWVKRFAR
jgi:chromate reductase, NAD(P)H dehydrogenase (quinone)